MFKLLFVVAAVFILSTGIALAGDTNSEEDSFSVVLEAGSNVIISNIFGDITIEEWDSDSVLIEYIIEGENLEETESIDVTFENINGILCEVTYPDEWHSSTEARVNFHVRLPESLDLNLVMQTVVGCISMKNGMGTSLVEIIEGSAVLEEFSGELTVNVVSGEIDLIHVSGLSVANVVDGTISGIIDSIERDIDISTVSGLIDLVIEDTATVSVISMSGEIDIPGVEVNHDLVGCSAEYGDGEFNICITTVSGDVIIRH
ncbi:MAG: DUF4097 domain-containing protein [Candidatus Aegiribacteria sp.]|nr:DUF4097 domain-containing protein [Candidatus Aegiribacteria sp.]